MRRVWRGRCAIEHEIRREMNHATSPLARERAREISWPVYVAAARALGIALRSIDRGIRAGVDDYIRSQAMQTFINLDLIRDIEIGVTERMKLDPGGSELDAGASNLARGTGQQYPSRMGHKYGAAWNALPFESRADSSGVIPAGNGHSMRTSGSSHRSTRSCCGA